MTDDHIKMPAIEPLVRYRADGVKTNYSYPFPIFASEDLAVYFDGARQYSGFFVNGAGKTEGGTVVFVTPPPADIVLMLERRMELERLTDFLEGGDFSARALNNELDFLLAAIQQVGRDQSPMLRYSDHEEAGTVVIPGKSIRAGQVLGFDGDGNPVAVSVEGTMAAPDFTASGTGAVTRSSQDKFSDLVSVKDFGAVGDGLSDDTLAFQQALAAKDAVLVPEGIYLITAPVTVAAEQALIGTGPGSVIKAQSNSFNALELPGGGAVIRNLRIDGGLNGIKLFGRDAPARRNIVANIDIVGAERGIVLDGDSAPAYPCEANLFENITITEPLADGVLVTKGAGGNAPAANSFRNVRVFSEGAPTSGSGFFVEHGDDGNSFVDCLASLNGETATSCFRVGAGAAKTLLLNLQTISDNGVPNLVFENGSSETAIINLHARSDGAAIADNSGGNYDAYNAGYPDKNRLRKTVVTDLKATLIRFDTEFIDSAGLTSLDLSHSVHIVDATNGAVTIELPAAATAAGAQITIKKKDATPNIVTITESAGAGPDGGTLQLGGENDYATMLCNGAEWFITSSNRMAGNTRYAEASGLYEIDMAVDTYLVSSYGGAVTARLPPANAPEAIGRTVTIKKTDNSANAVTVTEQGGAGPDQASQSLANQYDAISVLSDGAQWFVLSRYP